MKITVRQLAAVKRVAQNVRVLECRKRALEDKIAAIGREVAGLQEEIDAHETGIVHMTGHTSGEIVVRVAKATGRYDGRGRAVVKATYEPIAGHVAYDKKSGMYDILLDGQDVPASAGPAAGKEKAPDGLLEAMTENSGYTVREDAPDDGPVDPLEDLEGLFKNRKGDIIW